MSIGAILIGIAILVATVPFIVNPLLNEKRRKPTAAGLKPATPEDRHTEALLALRDLEFDYQIGKITDVDYTHLHTSLIAQAAAALEVMDNQHAELDIRLEEAIRTRRMKQSIAAKACSHCGVALADSDRFCRACGTPVSSTCPKCKKKVQPRDLFCVGCGAPLHAAPTTAPSTATIEAPQ